MQFSLWAVAVSIFFLNFNLRVIIESNCNAFSTNFCWRNQISPRYNETKFLPPKISIKTNPRKTQHLHTWNSILLFNNTFFVVLSFFAILINRPTSPSSWDFITLSRRKMTYIDGVGFNFINDSSISTKQCVFLHFFELKVTISSGFSSMNLEFV